MEGGQKQGPLSGVRVIELGNFIAAPTAGRLLAEFGAEVVKVERPGSGDEVRAWRSHGMSPSLFYRYLARNKKSVTIDLHAQAGQQLARELIDTADVLIENFRPGTLERWGLGPDVLRRSNPGLVVVRISGFGQTGPYARRAGFGGVAEAMAGLRHLTGQPGQMPVRVGISLGDQVAGLYAVIGTLLGLRERDLTSTNRASGDAARARGESVDVALYEAVYSLMESMVPDYDAFGIVPGPSGADISGVAPSGTYECCDGGYVVVGGNGDAIFSRLMTVIDRTDLRDDPTLSSNVGRAERHAELNAAVAGWTSTRTADDAVETLTGVGVPCGKIYTAADIAVDPQYEARHMLVDAPVQFNGSVKEISFPGIVPKLSIRPGMVTHLGPDLGADTDAVLARLGHSSEQLQRLRDQGVI